MRTASVEPGDMDTRMIGLQTPDGPMDLYAPTPKEDPTTAMIVVQEAFGVNDHIQDVTRRFGHQEVRYADADHGFHNDVRPAYDAAAAAGLHGAIGRFAGEPRDSSIRTLFVGIDHAR